MSVFGKLKSSSAKTKSKSNHEIVTDEALDPVCDEFIKASRDYKNAEAALNNAKATIIDSMRVLFSENMSTGQATKTFKINSKVQCQFTDRFKAPSDADIEELRDLVGQKVDKLFKQKASLKIKEGVSTNEAKLQELIELLGDKLEVYFDVGVSYTAIDDLDQHLAAEGCYKEVEPVIERLRYTPSIKVG
jgi:arsenate reductase-like glutaredoxin family protein